MIRPEAVAAVHPVFHEGDGDRWALIEFRIVEAVREPYRHARAGLERLAFSPGGVQIANVRDFQGLAAVANEALRQLHYLVLNRHGLQSRPAGRPGSGGAEVQLATKLLLARQVESKLQHLGGRAEVFDLAVELSGLDGLDEPRPTDDKGGAVMDRAVPGKLARCLAGKRSYRTPVALAGLREQADGRRRIR